MKTFHLTAWLAVMFLTVAPCTAGTLFCDDYGNCTGSTDEGELMQLHTDDYGTTMGFVGDSPVHLYSDPYGNTTGFIGDNPVHLYSDSYGNTMGFVGDDSAHALTDDFGTTIW